MLLRTHKFLLSPRFQRRTAAFCGRSLSGRRPGRVLASLLIAALFAGSVHIDAFSAQKEYQSVSVDETLYISADYYGAAEKSSIVKKVFFGTEKSYTDFGAYTAVTNMSSTDEIVLRNDRLFIPAPTDKSFLYFEGELSKESVVLPFEFSVSYKLNGVTLSAEDIAGRSGLVEIDIDVYPVGEASEYMRNNFVLAAAIPFGGENIYSVDAPGSQRAALGSYSAIVFETLPGEESHFTARLGTDSFEMSGIIFMMSPLTASDLTNIKDLKELEDRFRENTDSMLTDIETLMDTVSEMSGELRKTNLALIELEAGRNIVKENADGILAANRDIVDDLTRVSDTLAPLSDSLKTAEWLFYDINRELSALDQDMLSLGERTAALETRLKNLGSSLDSVDTISEAELKKELLAVEEELQSVLDMLSEKSGIDEALAEAAEKLEEIYKGLLQYGDLDADVLRAILSIIEELSQLSDIMENISAGLENIFSESNASSLIYEAASLSESFEDISHYAGSVSFQTARVLSSLDTLAGDLDSLTTTLSSYHADIETALQNTDSALSSVSKTTEDTRHALSLIDETLEKARANFSLAADYALEAGTEAIEHGLLMTDDVAGIRESGSDLRQSIDEEFDRLESESNFLNIDPDLEMVSLTSSRNPSPASIAVIVRTAEISAAQKEAKAILDAEELEAESTAFERIIGVFKKIWETVKGFFG